MSVPSSRSPVSAASAPPPRVVDIFSRAPVDAPALDREMRFREVARALHLNHYSQDRTIVEKLRLLHRDHGMPLPVNFRWYRGRRASGADSIWSGSIWDRGQFSAWHRNLFDSPQGRAVAADGDRHLLRAGLARIRKGGRP